jgi:hypothetical protein
MYSMTRFRVADLQALVYSKRRMYSTVLSARSSFQRMWGPIADGQRSHHFKSMAVLSLVLSPFHATYN